MAQNTQDLAKLSDAEFQIYLTQKYGGESYGLKLLRENTMNARLKLKKISSTSTVPTSTTSVAATVSETTLAQMAEQRATLEAHNVAQQQRLAAEKAAAQAPKQAAQEPAAYTISAEQLIAAAQEQQQAAAAPQAIPQAIPQASNGLGWVDLTDEQLRPIGEQWANGKAVWKQLNALGFDMTAANWKRVVPRLNAMGLFRGVKKAG